MTLWQYREPKVGSPVVFRHDGVWCAALITNASAQRREEWGSAFRGQSLVVFPAMMDSYVVEVAEHGWGEGCWHFVDE